LSALSGLERGFFIVVEGIDGAGKTVISQKLVEFLRSRGYEAVYTYEPFDSHYVFALKNYYSFLRDAYLDALTYAADRIVHLKTVILPHLARGSIVVCDRYYYSSVAYQTAQGAPMEWVLEVNKIMVEPDIAVYLDVDPVTALARKRGSTSRFPEYENETFLESVRRVYLELVNRGMLVMIDARRELEEVFNEVLSIVLSKLGFPRNRL